MEKISQQTPPSLDKPRSSVVKSQTEPISEEEKDEVHELPQTKRDW